MKIVICGAGKLGLPVALAMDAYRHEVSVFDRNPEPGKYLHERKIPYKEERADELLQGHEIKPLTDERFVDADLIFVAVQTPHDPAYEGITPVPYPPKDFNYKFLIQAITDINNMAADIGKKKDVVIISTVLPGTLDRVIIPTAPNLNIVYNPFFIAMGTVIPDFLEPEFVLIGYDRKEEDCPEDQDPLIITKLKEFYASFHSAPIEIMNIKEAELTKVSYNTFISQKIIFANNVMEICQKMGGMNADTVMGTLKKATTRLISTKYLDPGMGDGGGCHPRDNIAMSWLSSQLGMSVDMGGSVSHIRDGQTQHLADLISDIWHEEGENPDVFVILLGKSFKPETNLTIGSPALLLNHFLVGKGFAPTIMYDPYVRSEEEETPDELEEPHIFVISTKHEYWKTFSFPDGSVVIDPFRYLGPAYGIKYIPVGGGPAIDNRKKE